jgi:phage-related protein
MAGSLLDVFVRIGADTSDLESGISKTKGLVGGLGNAIGTGMKVAGAAIAGATAAVTAFGMSAVKNYASYEQLVGGVSKLYGTAGASIEEYAKSQGKSIDEVREKYDELTVAEQMMAEQANNAFKTAGMSANQYMETATSFSAALINSVGGNTIEAARLTDVAMAAISDNVNTFGSDMGSVTNAFQGFAKQNYTMLDNLKLGYGGTKEEMERLIEDANEYRATIGETADLSIDSFADVVEAIQSVQEAQNIAGTTSREAMTTIEGSAAATKAAWQNVITAIGRGEGLSEAFDGLVTSIFGEKDGEGLLNQIIPRIETTMQGIGDFIATASPYISDKLPALVEAVVPNAINAGLQLISAIGKGIADNAGTILFAIGDVAEMMLNGLLEATQNGGQVISGIFEWIVGVFQENYTSLIDVGMQIIANIISGIGQALPTVIPAIVDLVLTIATKLIDNVPLLIDAAVQLILGLADGLIKAIPVLVSKLPEIIKSIVGALIKSVPLLIDGALQLVQGVIDALPTIIESLIAVIPQLIDEFVNAIVTYLPVIIEGIVQLVMGIVEALPQIIEALVSAIPMIIQTITDALLANLPQLIAGMIQLTMAIVAALPQIIGALITAIPQIVGMLAEAIITNGPLIIESVISILTTVGTTLLEYGSQFLSDIGSSMSEIFNTVVQWLSQLPSQLAYWAGFAIGEFVKFFVSLPSKLLNLLNTVITNIKTFGENLKTNAINSGKSFFNGIVDNIKNLPSNLRQLATQLLNIVKELPNKFLSIGKNIVDGLWNGIKNAWNTLKDNVTGLFGSLVSGIKDSLGIASPSKVFAEIGKFVDMGYAKGILDNMGVVGSAMSELENATIDPQITTTTSNAPVQDDVVRLLEEIAENRNVTVILEGDADRLFRVVQSQSRRNKQITGQESFA